MKQPYLLKWALILAISAWNVKGASLGRPAAPAKAGSTITLTPQLKAFVKGNKVEVSGQVAVMSINALLTKIIFDKNPEREFYIEESFPLDWMYPHLTPHGLILKINRQPLAALPESDVLQDRAFWSKLVQRYLGDWLTYDTPVPKVCAFVELVFGEKELGSFHCDPQFVKDDDACKEFSKLRTSIAGVYAWRLNNTKAGADRERMANEADFAFRQAFALCPNSPEALYRYVNLLITRGRSEDALTLAETAHKLDPGKSSTRKTPKFNSSASRCGEWHPRNPAD
ncbi:MAG: hypothetical protein NTW03_15160 [Verrucomicrobia bacterium]|nr:hypothetical protein [Verrucomicrobiota bacterium]